MKCTSHPNVETDLRCGKCERPICPRCMVQTPVGARCGECARFNKLPTYRVSISHYVRAVGAGVGIALGMGVVWGLLARFLPFFYLNIILGGAIGYAVGEIISLAVNRKRGLGLAVIAGLAMCLAYLIALLIPWGLRFTLFDLAALGLGVFAAVTRVS